MGRHSASQDGTVELPAVTGKPSGRHRPEVLGQPPIRASRKTRRAADSRAGKRRANPRTHRPVPRLQTAVLAGLLAFSAGTAVVGTGWRSTRLETQRPAPVIGTWMQVRPGSLTGASGGEWVTSTPRLTDPILTPSPGGTTRRVAPLPGSSTPAGSQRATGPAPALTSPSSGAGSSPSTPAADPTSAEPTPSPAPAPTAVRKRCRRHG